MTQYDFGAIDPGQTSGAELAELLGDFRDAINTCHRGNSRPSYAAAGMLWIKTGSPYSSLMYFDGSADKKILDLAAQGTLPIEATGLKVEDTRAVARTPDDYADNQVTAEFTDRIISGWHSAMTVQGWYDGYAAWQIIGGAASGVHENIYFRSGKDETWGALRKIWHEGNHGSGSGLDADKLDGQQGSYYRSASNLNAGTVPSARLSGTYNISISGSAASAASATNASQLGGTPANNIVSNGGATYFVHDTRDVDTPTDFGDRGAKFEFKRNSTDGLADGGAYHSVMTVQNWEGSSGGNTHQIGFTQNGNVYYRTATIGGSWGAWKRLLQDGLGVGEVGTYGLFWDTWATSVAPGDTAPGSRLRYAGTFAYGGISYANTAPTGTWQCMGVSGYYQGNSAYQSQADKRATLWMRIA